MEYAIETLKIELYNLKQMLRVGDRYSVHPEYPGGTISDNEIKKRMNELNKAIEELNKQEIEDERKLPVL